MKNIRFICQIFGIDGYSSHGRQLVNALYGLKKFNIKLETILPQGWEAMVNDSELNMITNETVTMSNDYTTIFIGLPPQYRMVLGDNPKEFYGYVVWEGDSIPPYWLKYLDKSIYPKIKGLIVPSNHTKQAILNTQEKYKIAKELSPIHIIPHGVNLNLFQLDLSKRNKLFSFIMCGGWRLGINDRKGIQYGIKAFCEEFKKEEDVQMWIKINPAYCPPNFNLNDELEKLGLPKKEDRPKIFISMGAVDYKILPTWYNQGHVFVSPTMAEAFNLTCIEAMACGLPVITSNFGGQIDFINNDNGWLIDYDLIDVTWDLQYEGIKWGKPNLEQLKKMMREIFEVYKIENGNNFSDNKHIQKRANALETARNYTWTNSAKKLSEVI